jgi:hypothetical protein
MTLNDSGSSNIALTIVLSHSCLTHHSNATAAAELHQNSAVAEMKAIEQNEVVRVSESRGP